MDRFPVGAACVSLGRSPPPLSAPPFVLEARGSFEFNQSCSAAGRDLRRDG